MVSAAATLQPEQPEAALRIPVWDNCVGELRYLGLLIKRFRKAASNQRTVLNAFQTQGWPEWLANPLRRSESVGQANLKQRLHDTIKNLNRDHQTRAIRFHGMDYGCAVGWRALA